MERRRSLNKKLLYKKTPINKPEITTSLSPLKRTALSAISSTDNLLLKDKFDANKGFRSTPSGLVTSPFFTNKWNEVFKILDPSGTSAKPFVELTSNPSEKHYKSYDPSIVKNPVIEKKSYICNSRENLQRSPRKLPPIKLGDGLSFVHKIKNSDADALDKFIKHRSSVSQFKPVSPEKLIRKNTNSNLDLFKFSFLNEQKSNKPLHNGLSTNLLSDISEEAGATIEKLQAKTTTNKETKEFQFHKEKISRKRLERSSESRIERNFESKKDTPVNELKKKAKIPSIPPLAFKKGKFKEDKQLNLSKRSGLGGWGEDVATDCLELSYIIENRY
ncbi:unnamed protein product [Blepharisma stoltei]|uniref:Uncharacterized protein n=1 Tax=Blepharisma stoltei TaxID=1481888 RepID=A0AAU9JD93_9CILI|nr:unnamed protein product [Blepharisma stoltei]